MYTYTTSINIFALNEVKQLSHAIKNRRRTQKVAKAKAKAQAKAKRRKLPREVQKSRKGQR